MSMDAYMDVDSTTAWMQEVESRREQRPKKISGTNFRIHRKIYICYRPKADVRLETLNWYLWSLAEIRVLVNL